MNRYRTITPRTKTLLASLLVAALVSSLGRSDASASSIVGPGTSPGSYSVTLYTVASASAPGNPGSTTTVTTKTGKTLFPVMFPTITTNSALFNNTPCIALYFAYYSNTAQVTIATHMAPQLFYTLNRSYPQCQYRNSPTPVQATPASISKTTLVSTVTHLLPIPDPWIEPGFGLVALPAFLTSGAKLTDRFQTTLAGQEILGIAHGSLSVDFGDGTVIAPTTNLGGVWPNGDLSHPYGSTGCFRITVTENWSISYSVGGQSGTLRGISTQGSIPSFCVFRTGSIMIR